MAAGLFLCLFASQSAVIAMAPPLFAAAADLHVSIAASLGVAGQQPAWR